LQEIKDRFRVATGLALAIPQEQQENSICVMWLNQLKLSDKS
jgi:hypothetical protein